MGKWVFGRWFETQCWHALYYISLVNRMANAWRDWNGHRERFFILKSKKTKVILWNRTKIKANNAKKGTRTWSNVVIKTNLPNARVLTKTCNKTRQRATRISKVAVSLHKPTAKVKRVKNWKAVLKQTARTVVIRAAIPQQQTAASAIAVHLTKVDKAKTAAHKILIKSKACSKVTFRKNLYLSDCIS